MDRLRKELLAGSGLPRDEDRQIGPCDGFDILEQRLHGGTSGDDIAKCFRMLRPFAEKRLLEHFILIPHLRELKAPPHRAHQPGVVDRLYQVVERPAFHALHRALDVVDGCNDDDRSGGVGSGYLREELSPGDIGHVHVEHHQAVRLLRKQSHHVPAVPAGLDIRDPVRRHGELDAQQEMFLVVDEEDGVDGDGAGIHRSALRWMWLLFSEHGERNLRRGAPVGSAGENQASPVALDDIV